MAKNLQPWYKVVTPRDDLREGKPPTLPEMLAKGYGWDRISDERHGPAKPGFLAKTQRSQRRTG